MRAKDFDYTFPIVRPLLDVLRGGHERDSITLVVLGEMYKIYPLRLINQIRGPRPKRIHLKGFTVRITSFIA